MVVFYNFDFGYSVVLFFLKCSVFSNESTFVTTVKLFFLMLLLLLRFFFSLVRSYLAN